MPDAFRYHFTHPTTLEKSPKNIYPKSTPNSQSPIPAQSTGDMPKYFLLRIIITKLHWY
jgi:hypothetical protein